MPACGETGGAWESKGPHASGEEGTQACKADAEHAAALVLAARASGYNPGRPLVIGAPGVLGNLLICFQLCGTGYTVSYTISLKLV